MTYKIEFKYDPTEENVMMQMAGKLRGLKALNRSKINPELDGTSLVLEVTHLDPTFFTSGMTIDNKKHHNYDRKEAIGYLTETFTQTEVWAKITSEDGEVRKVIIPRTTEVERLEPMEKMFIKLTVEPEDAEA